MKIIKFYSVLHLLLISSIFSVICSVTAVAQTPPKYFIDKGACPFECCTYRSWKVIKNTALYDHINGKRIIGIAKKGTMVQGLTGEVHTIPTIIQFQKTLQDTSGFDYQQGTNAYLLTYLGEGLYKAWYNGQIIEWGQPACIDNSEWGAGVKDCCKDIHILKKGSSVWWSQIKLKNGISGWTQEMSHFTNIDSCG